MLNLNLILCILVIILHVQEYTQLFVYLAEDTYKTHSQSLMFNLKQVSNFQLYIPVRPGV